VRSIQTYRRFVAGLVAAFLILGGRLAIARAQGRQFVVRVLVTDSSRSPLGGAVVTVIRDGAGLVQFGRTDAEGRATFALQRDDGSYRVAARQLGYSQAASQPLTTTIDTILVTLILVRLPPARLDTVRVAERPLTLAKQPFVGADEIAHDTRSVLSLRDVVLELRPDIDYQAYRCMRVAPRIPISRGGIPRSRIRRSRGVPDPPSARVYVNGVWVEPEDDPWNSIHADHIAELRYVNCNDRSIPGLPSSPFASIYVVLKPGIEWDIKGGSHPIDPPER
jgi:hypothetical protein